MNQCKPNNKSSINTPSNTIQYNTTQQNTQISNQSAMIISPRLMILSTVTMASFLLSLSSRVRVVRGFVPRLSSVAASRSASRPRAALSHFHSQSQSQSCYQDINNMNMNINNSRSKSVSRLFSTKTDDASSDTDKKEQEQEQKQIPMTLLAGFLGSGKTTTLQNLLTNNDGLKIGIIVNDVASINIDSKLLSNPIFSSTETIELQNGCACCSLADELLTSVEQLTDSGKRDLDAIVVELSGVADPVQIRSNWEEASASDHPATKFAKMDKIVTLIDSSTFGTDWMTWDTSGDREGWIDPADPCGAERKVPELLAEQVEAADVLVINKIDLADEEQVRVATGLAKSLNDKAGVFAVKFGDISVKEVLQAAKVEREIVDCSDPDCTDDGHSHAHSHDHATAEVAAAEASCSKPDCTDESHAHSHSHDHDSSAASCSDPGCTDESHSHDHDSAEPSCSDPDCTDDSHGHSHSHDHQSTSTSNLGITNFVYKSDRPFNPTRLLTILNKWPVPIKEELDLGQLAEAAEEGYDMDGRDEKSAFVGVLRSKGFCWMAPTKWIGANDDVWRHNTAMFWSHAGKHFGISTAGKWWGTIKPEQMKSYFRTNDKEYERILKEDFVSEEFGDRRQELVFIGANIDEEEITKALDECLCTDEEMGTYRQQVRNFEETTFNAVAKPIKPVSPDEIDGPSLFDVGGTDHMDEGANIRGD